MPISPSRASARTVSESMRAPILSLGATSSSIACMIEGTPAITITLPIQKPGAPDTLLRMRSAPLTDQAGDGTTTATILAHAIVKEGAKGVAAGMNPMDLKRGVDLA